MATELALLPVHSAVWARHCLGLTRTGPANWLTMSSPVQSSTPVTAALQGCEKKFNQIQQLNNTLPWTSADERQGPEGAVRDAGELKWSIPPGYISFSCCLCSFSFKSGSKETNRWRQATLQGFLFPFCGPWGFFLHCPQAA